MRRSVVSKKKNKKYSAKYLKEKLIYQIKNFSLVGYLILIVTRSKVTDTLNHIWAVRWIRKL